MTRSFQKPVNTDLTDTANIVKENAARISPDGV